MAKTLSDTARYSEDAVLLNKVSHGDHEAVNTLYDAYFNRIYSFIFNQVARDREAANDIVQETFIAALKAARKFDGRSKAYTWLYSIAARKVADFYRQKKRVDRHQFEPVNSDTEIDQLYDSNQVYTGVEPGSDDSQMVEQAITALPLHYRQVLILKYVEDMPVIEIGQVMKRSPKSIEGLLSRARKELRDRITVRNEGKS